MTALQRILAILFTLVLAGVWAYYLTKPASRAGQSSKSTRHASASIEESDTTAVQVPARGDINRLTEILRNVEVIDVTISGSIETGLRTPVEGAQVLISTNPPTGWDLESAGSWGSGKSDAAGRFELKGRLLIPTAILHATVVCDGFARTVSEVRVVNGKADDVDINIDLEAAIEGTILFGEEPPRDPVNVSVWQNDSLLTEVETGIDGRYRIDKLTAGETLLRLDWAQPVVSLEYSVKPGQHISDANFHLPERTARIRGLVLDRLSKQPVADAKLYLVDAQTGIHAYSASATSDEKGAFEFAQLVPGEYTIKAMRATWIEDTPAATGQTDVVVWRSQEYPVEISGTVREAGTGNPLNDFTVNSVRFKTSGIDERDANEQGYFVISELPSENTKLEVHKIGFVPKVVIIDTRAGTPLKLDFELERGAEIVVQVLTPEGVPLENVAVEVVSDDEQESSMNIKTFTGSEGIGYLFEIGNGKNNLLLQHPDFPPTPATVTVNGNSETPVQLTLSPWGTLRGIVRSPEGPEANAQVLLEQSRLRTFSTTTDDAGAYTFESVRTGTATVTIPHAAPSEGSDGSTFTVQTKAGAETVFDIDLPNPIANTEEEEPASIEPEL